MSSALPMPTAARDDAGSARRFALVMLLVAAGSALLSGWLPLGLAIGTVFLFAGPHNWIEIRYFLARLPARWGKLWPFFLFSFAGIGGLTLSFIALPWFGSWYRWDTGDWLTATALWNTVLVLWMAVLIEMRSRQNPRRDWSWAWPVAFVLIALTWWSPALWSLGIVYAHPLLAFWILDRELQRSRPEWLSAYRLSLLSVPVLIGALWWQLAQAPALRGDDVLTLRITQHAGAGLLSGLSTHFLVALHTFTQVLHYGVWLLAIPLVGLRSAPWEVATLPMARRSLSWRRLVQGILLVGGAITLLLWACFLIDYPTTRDVYFAWATFHVLAEVPFLLRAL